MTLEQWYVLAALLAPTGYMIQDSVADAMTVEAVPRLDEHGKPYDEPHAQERCIPPCRRWGASR